jgi:DNA repair protein RAD50
VSKAYELDERKTEKQLEIESLQPDLDRLVKAVDDQERHKKNLKENIDLIISGQRIEELEKVITKLKQEASNVEGHDTCNEDFQRMSSRKEKMLSSKARLQGRRGKIVESIRSLKVSFLYGT